MAEHHSVLKEKGPGEWGLQSSWASYLFKASDWQKKRKSLLVLKKKKRKKKKTLGAGNKSHENPTSLGDF